MSHVRNARSFSFSGALLAGLLVSCTNAPSAVVPSGKNGNVNASGKNCARNAGMKLDNGGLSLTAPEMGQQNALATRPISLVRDIENGGWLDVGFWGVPFKKFAVKSNPEGYVEVLNIPYCIKQQSLGAQSDVWISRCLNRELQDRLGKNENNDKSDFISAYSPPQEVFKRCTASFTVDPDDTQIQSGNTRVRVWTAEHCYQPAYSTNVILQIYLPEEKKGVYVPFLMNAVDGSVWRKKVLETNGVGGESADPKLADKILVLRSSDGRSSDLFRDTYNKYCRQHTDSESFPQFSDGKAAEQVDCFSMTDLATFKGTVSLQQPALKKMANNSRIAKADIAALRTKALAFLVKKSLESKSNPIDSIFASKFPEPVRKNITVSKFVLSIFDGLQHARRVRAFKQELDSRGLTDPKQAEQQLSQFGHLFSMPVVDVSNEQLLGIVEQSAKKLVCSAEGKITAGIGGIGGDFLKGFIDGAFNCNARQFMPLDTKAMEDVVLGRPAAGFFDFIMERINVVVAIFANNAFLEKNHPLKVNVSDSPFLANLKFLGLQIKYWIDVMLLHKNPAAGNPFVAPLARTLQDVLEASCGAQSFGAKLFPVMGNVRKDSGFDFEIFVPVKMGTSLSVIPIGITNRDDYRQSRCFDSSARDLGGSKEVVDPLDPKKIIFFPEKTIFGVHVNDAALVPPTDDELRQNSDLIEQRLINYVSSRVIFKFAGASNDSFSVGEYGGDSGAMLSFMGLPSFVISTHNKEPVNGIVLAELPEPNTPEEEFEAGRGSAQNCLPAAGK
jgi:hypothetical protein